MNITDIFGSLPYQFDLFLFAPGANINFYKNLISKGQWASLNRFSRSNHASAFPLEDMNDQLIPRTVSLIQKVKHIMRNKDPRFLNLHAGHRK